MLTVPPVPWSASTPAAFRRNSIARSLTLARPAESSESRVSPYSIARFIPLRLVSRAIATAIDGREPSDKPLVASQARLKGVSRPHSQPYRVDSPQPARRAIAGRSRAGCSARARNAACWSGESWRMASGNSDSGIGPVGTISLFMPTGYLRSLETVKRDAPSDKNAAQRPRLPKIRQDCPRFVSASGLDKGPRGLYIGMDT